MKADEYLKHRNYWWETGQIKENDHGQARAGYLKEIFQRTERERIICLTGVRRSGKTTLMFQMMEQLIRQGVNPKKLVYFKVNEVDFSDLNELISHYSALTGFSPEKEEIYFFLDEIPYLKNWQNQIGFFIEARYPGKFIISGSSRTLLYRDASESLTGRITFINVFPLTFREFLQFNRFEIKTPLLDIKNLKLNELKKLSLDLTKLKPQIKFWLNQYLEVGGYPEWFKIKDEYEWRKILSQDYLPLIIFKDIVQIFRPKNPLVLEKLAREIAFFSTQRFTYSKLSNRLDLDRESIKQYLFYLKTALLIFSLEIYTKSGKSGERAEKKLIFWEEGLRKSIVEKSEESVSIENVVLWHLIKRNQEDWHIFYEPKYFKSLEEVDFIYLAKKPLPVEVKYRRQINKKDLKGILSFMERFSLRQGLVISRDILEKRVLNGKEILFIPAWLLLLVC